VNDLADLKQVKEWNEEATVADAALAQADADAARLHALYQKAAKDRKDLTLAFGGIVRLYGDKLNEAPGQDVMQTVERIALASIALAQSVLNREKDKETP